MHEFIHFQQESRQCIENTSRFSKQAQAVGFYGYCDGYCEAHSITQMLIYQNNIFSSIATGIHTYLE